MPSTHSVRVVYVYLAARAYILPSLDSASKPALLQWLPTPEPEGKMDVDTPAGPATRHTSIEPVPEVEIYLRLLIIHHLLSDKSTYAQALKLSQETVQKMQSLNRRSMDPIAAKVWYAVERAHELGGELADARP